MRFTRPPEADEVVVKKGGIRMRMLQFPFVTPARAHGPQLLVIIVRLLVGAASSRDSLLRRQCRSRLEAAPTIVGYFRDITPQRFSIAYFKNIRHYMR